MARLSIGALATGTGVKVETIRFYERIGVMPEPDRTEGGHRSYTDAHRKHLIFIRRARGLGFSLDDVRALLGLSGTEALSCHQVEILATAHLTEVRAKISDLTRLEAVLDKTVRRCATHADPACPLIEMLGDDPRAGQSMEPMSEAADG
ncbi:helix-turn-helix domain-containing protein [uncultured Brevundimonas sp.]|uniref:MerR family transcriptional regulator n=1 Tax=uncultured Brevundimonas sp. TaxID=213418 RepID=UPI0030EEF1CD|tara:strand:+ start:6883 stop:7329 length:447 start_codon:yes stop_codon:yes gene_type:complete